MREWSGVGMLCWLLSIAVLGRAAERYDPALIETAAFADKARSAVMLMAVCDASGLEIAHGTGFLVSNDGRLITNRHVIRAGPIAFAKARSGKRYKITGFLSEDP